MLLEVPLTAERGEEGPKFFPLLPFSNLLPIPPIDWTSQREGKEEHWGERV